MQASESRRQPINSTSLRVSVASCRNRRGNRPRSGFTLLEVMIATAVTLLMMLSLSQVFKIIGDSMQRGRAIMELNNRLRTVTHRIRTDLAHLTISPRPPADPGNGAGYFKYYDGPMTDFTTASTASSRIGDCDDIIMGTIKAKDTWFTGKVPRFILEQRIPVDASEFSPQNMLTIASQYAELAIFAQPQVAISKPVLSASSPFSASTVNSTRDPGFLVLDPQFFQDDNGDGIPDTYRLHYRLLLIRPDLNLRAPIVNNGAGSVPAGVLPGNGAERLFRVAQPPNPELTTGSGTFSAPLPPWICDMTTIHAVCDLSVRRVFDPTTATDFVAANSLVDLVAPENRFAHTQVPIPGTQSTTMPVLALAPAMTLLGNNQNNGTLVGSGFLHPAYVLQGDRLGEDLLATDVIAFDVKAFDEGVPLLLDRGPNGSNEQGLAGTDDMVLSPNDPGYARLAASNSPRPTAVGTGEFVDLAWGHKARANGLALNSGANLWTQLSGLSTSNRSGGPGFTDTLLRSGQVLATNANNLIVQPTYDTWSTHYEGDGVLQTQLRNLIGVVRINGARDLYGITSGTDDLVNLRTTLPDESWRRNAIDAGTDNIDNPFTALGVDDITEMETSAPFNLPLRGIQVTVRMEDPKTRQVRQMSVVREFVNE